MSTYIIKCDSPNDTIGPFSTLAAAQTESQSLADAYVLGNSELAVSSTATLYVAVRTRTKTRTISGITLTDNNESFDATWSIIELTAP